MYYNVVKGLWATVILSSSTIKYMIPIMFSVTDSVNPVTPAARLLVIVVALVIFCFAIPLPATPGEL
jgi:hypothetical protein